MLSSDWTKCWVWAKWRFVLAPRVRRSFVPCDSPRGWTSLRTICFHRRCEATLVANGPRSGSQLLWRFRSGFSANALDWGGIWAKCCKEEVIRLSEHIWHYQSDADELFHSFCHCQIGSWYKILWSPSSNTRKSLAHSLEMCSGPLQLLNLLETFSILYFLFY